MAKSTVEKMNEKKERALKSKDQFPKVSEGKKGNASPSTVINEMDEFTSRAATKARKHKDPIGLNKEPGV